MSGGTPGRNDATAIQANGTAHSTGRGADGQHSNQSPVSSHDRSASRPVGSHDQARCSSARNESNVNANKLATLITVAAEASPPSLFFAACSVRCNPAEDESRRRPALGHRYDMIDLVSALTSAIGSTNPKVGPSNGRVRRASGAMGQRRRSLRHRNSDPAGTPANPAMNERMLVAGVLSPP